MKITWAVHAKKELWTIFLDNEPWKTIHSAIFGRRLNFPSECLSLSEWEQFFYEKECQQAKQYLLWRLSRQSLHSQQIKKILKEKLVTPSVIETVIEEFIQKGYLDDDHWIKSYINAQRKRFGLPIIASKLKAKGITIEDIEGIQDTEKEKEVIQHLLHTKYRLKDLSDRTQRQKVIASLLRKGFSYESIRRCCINHHRDH